MKYFYKKNQKSIDQIVAFAIFLICTYLCVRYMLKLVSPFVLALLLSVIISIPVDFLSKRYRIPRAFPTVVSMVIFLFAFGAALNMFINILTKQLLLFVSDFPETFNKSIIMFKSLQESYKTFFEIFPEDVGAFFDDGILTIIPDIISAVGKFARTSSVSVMKILPKTFVFILITIISTFFITKDKQVIFGFLKRQMPDKVLSAYKLLRADLFTALWGYIRAQLILMSISGTISGIGLTIMGYPYSFLLGLTIAFFDMLPVFGPGFVLWPWTLYCLLSGQHSFAFGLIVLYIIIIVCRQFTEPKILGSQIGIYPLVTLSSMYMGLMLLGPLGILAGPVLVVTVKSLQKGDMLPKFK